MNGVAELRIAEDHPSFAGHFPGMPIVPGVVLLDEALSAIAAALRLPIGRCTLTQVKFRSVARPGQELSLRFATPSPGRIRFAMESRGAVVAEGILSLSVENDGHRNADGNVSGR